MTNNLPHRHTTVDSGAVAGNAEDAGASGRFRTLLALLMARAITWCREEGYWYLTSMTAHAVGLFLLALISLTLPQVIMSRDAAPSFDAAKADNAASEIARFEIGNALEETTELTTESAEEFKALATAAQTARHYDDSPEFEEAGGGTKLDLKGMKLGGLGGPSFEGPGPGGAGGVGVGAGLGKNAGMGGEGEGFGFRGKGHREALAGVSGGTKPAERAVNGALNWLARHQAPSGHWSLDYRHQCKGEKCSTGGGDARFDGGGVTALALLPFLAAGHTPKVKSIYQQTVTKAIASIIKQQRPDGDLSGGSPKRMYTHGLATIALCEAYGMARDERVGAAARRAVAFIESAQNQSTGGWRYEPGDPGDTSVFGWQIMALKSAQLAGLAVNSSLFDNGQRWLHSVAKGEHLGLYSYQPYQPVTPTNTAVAMLCRQYMGIDPKDPGLLESKHALLENMPDNNLDRNTYYWYYATQAMHNFLDSDWDAWNRKIRHTLIETQVKEGCATGSWDPEKPATDAWAANGGGRLMTTAFSTLCLEVYYRKLPLFKPNSLAPRATKSEPLVEETGTKPAK